MICSFKNRELDYSKPFKVYRNLTRKGTWYSIQQSGKVVAHANYIGIKDCQFLVNASGKRRAIETGQRNVHAFIIGLHAGDLLNHHNFPSKQRITYNPYKDKNFYSIAEPQKEVNFARFVFCTENGVYAVL